MLRLLKYLVIGAFALLLLFDYFVMSPMYEFHRSANSEFARRGGQLAQALNRTFYASESARQMWDVRISELPETRKPCRDGDRNRPDPSRTVGWCVPFSVGDVKTSSHCKSDFGKCLEIETGLSAAEFLSHKGLSDFVTNRCEYFRSFIDQTKSDRDKPYYEKMVAAIGCDGTRNTGSVPVFIVGADGDLLLKI